MWIGLKREVVGGELWLDVRLGDKLHRPSLPVSVGGGGVRRERNTFVR